MKRSPNPSSWGDLRRPAENSPIFNAPNEIPAALKRTRTSYDILQRLITPLGKYLQRSSSLARPATRLNSSIAPPSEGTLAHLTTDTEFLSLVASHPSSTSLARHARPSQLTLLRHPRRQVPHIQMRPSLLLRHRPLSSSRAKGIPSTGHLRRRGDCRPILVVRRC